MAKSRARLWFTNLFWTTTKTNVLGWAVERQHIFTRKYQHLVHSTHGAWQPGELPKSMSHFTKKR